MIFFFVIRATREFFLVTDNFLSNGRTRECSIFQMFRVEKRAAGKKC